MIKRTITLTSSFWLNSKQDIIYYFFSKKWESFLKCSTKNNEKPRTYVIEQKHPIDMDGGFFSNSPAAKRIQTELIVAVQVFRTMIQIF